MSGGAPGAPAAAVDARRQARYTCRLTVPLPLRYKAALAAVLLTLPGVALPERIAGAVLPDEAVKVGDNRYRVRKSYDDTLKFFRSVYAPGKFRRRPIADQPATAPLAAPPSPSARNLQSR